MRVKSTQELAAEYAAKRIFAIVKNRTLLPFLPDGVTMMLFYMILHGIKEYYHHFG